MAGKKMSKILPVLLVTKPKFGYILMTFVPVVISKIKLDKNKIIKPHH